MMDGRIGAIRSALDAEDMENVLIMSYAAKFASGLYNPFRNAVGSSASLGKADKKTYQINPANSREAIKEILYDEVEGADMVIVKPASFYLDVIKEARGSSLRPIVAYQVSGEYAMLKAAAANDWLDYEKVMIEALTAFKRAGANGILTYAAVEAARLLKGK